MLCFLLGRRGGGGVEDGLEVMDSCQGSKWSKVSLEKLS